MDSLLTTLVPCLTSRRRERGIQLPSDSVLSYPSTEKSFNAFEYEDRNTLSADAAAKSIVTALQSAKTPGVSLDADIKSIVHQAGGWSDYLAQRVLTGLEAVLRAGKEKLGPAIKKAYEKAVEAAKVFKDFSAEHPIATAVFCTVIAIGMLVVLAPSVLEILGFAAEGPLEGELPL